MVKTVAVGSEVLKLCEKGDPMSLEPILQKLHEWTKETKKTELANNFVKILLPESEIHKYFTDEQRMHILAIVV